MGWALFRMLVAWAQALQKQLKVFLMWVVFLFFYGADDFDFFKVEWFLLPLSTSVKTPS